ncbi:MAG TPA: hypothetical protein VLH87_06265, partial [Pyrinomonadaceae bacterium]|nr:hypothetical protein [Pyrinomonadaceae bacterium]
MNPLSFPALRLFLSVPVVICASFALAGCSRGVVRETAAETRVEKPKPPTALPMWLGNPARSFFGTGPIPKSLKVIWNFKTTWTRGRL